jgi:hypothetical protein
VGISNGDGTAIVTIEYKRNRLPNAVAPNPIARNIRNTVTGGQGPVQRVARRAAAGKYVAWCIGANGTGARAPQCCGAEYLADAALP